MKTNVGSYDAGVRFVAGCGILFLGVHGLGWWALLGLVPILTTILGRCPLYCLFNVDTAAWEDAWEARHHRRDGKQQ